MTISKMSIGCSPLTGTIFVGKAKPLGNNNYEFTGQKHDVTQQAISAVATHMSHECKKSGLKNAKYTIEYNDGTLIFIQKEPQS